MATIDLNEALLRICEIEKEATLSINVRSSAVPRFLFTQETGDYWTNRIGNIAMTYPADEFDNYEVDLIARFTVAARSSGLGGDIEKSLYQVMEVFIQFLNASEGLQSTLYPTTQDDLEWARVVSCTGLVMDTGNSGVQVVGTEFTVRLTYRIANEQYYTT